MKVDNQSSVSETAKLNYSKNRTLLESMEKDIVFNSDKRKESLLDESNIKE
jgi:hypothetical protein